VPEGTGATSASWPWSPPRGRLVVGLAIAAVGPLLLAVALAPFRSVLTGATVGLVMLVPTAVAAAVGGPLAAVVAVVSGTVTHNVLFTAPLLTLRVTDPSEVAGLAVHALVATAVSLVVVREQRATRLAAHQQGAADRLRVLEEVDQARTALLGAVSHDLRTPLSAIAAAASDLREAEVEFSAAQRQLLLATIAERTAYLDRIVEQLLDASRLQTGAVRVVVEAVEVRDLVEEAAAAAGPEAAARVVQRFDAETPPVLVDPVLIVAAFRNLLENALRHAPPATAVEVEAAGAGEVVVVTVSDGGPGVVGDGDDIFEPFHGTSGGPGLGLAIARGFVEIHGGELSYHDADGGGASFELTLPAVEEPEA
jgi:two-component system, OmpR family, sensor histidine kinase KdpD